VFNIIEQPQWEDGTTKLQRKFLSFPWVTCCNALNTIYRQKAGYNLLVDDPFGHLIAASISNTIYRINDGEDGRLLEFAQFKERRTSVDVKHQILSERRFFSKFLYNFELHSFKHRSTICTSSAGNGQKKAASWYRGDLARMTFARWLPHCTDSSNKTWLEI
jgi:hypothetical protein